MLIDQIRVLFQKISHKQYFCFNSILALTVLLIYLVAGGLSHISTSEFWPITLSAQVWLPGAFEPSFFYKPVFHFILAPLYLLPLDNWSHVLAARLLFSLIGFVSYLLFINWSTKAFSIERSALNILLISVLFLVPSVVFQAVKVRSDILSLFFTLIILNLATPPQGGSEASPRWSSKRLLGIFAAHLALLMSTPRSVFLSLMLVVFLAVFLFVQGKAWQKPNRQFGRQFFLALLGPFLAMVMIGTYAAVLFPPMHNYLQASYATGFWDFGFLWNFLKAEPLMGVLAAIGFIFVRGYQSRILFLIAFGIFVLADLKTPYLLASLYPFLILPAVIFLTKTPTLANSQRKKIFGFLICGVVILSNLFLGSADKWMTSNLSQKDVIQKVSKVLGTFPEYTYFDGMGALPRSKQIISYLGPYDSIAIDGAWYKIKAQKPDLLLVTARTAFMEPGFIDYLLLHYRAIGPNIFLEKHRQWLEKPIELADIPYLIFQL